MVSDSNDEAKNDLSAYMLDPLEVALCSTIGMWRHDSESETISARRNLSGYIGMECQGRAKTYEQCADELERVLLQHLRENAHPDKLREALRRLGKDGTEDKV